MHSELGRSPVMQEKWDALDGRYAFSELGALESLLYDRLEFFYPEIYLKDPHDGRSHLGSLLEY